MSRPFFETNARTVIPGTLGLILTLVASFACAPKVQVVTPDKPIEINMNIKVEHQITVKVDKELDSLFAEEEDIF